MSDSENLAASITSPLVLKQPTYAMIPPGWAKSGIGRKSTQATDATAIFGHHPLERRFRLACFPDQFH